METRSPTKPIAGHAVRFYNAIVQELRARHLISTICNVQAAGDILVLDSREMLATFMIDDQRDDAHFRASVIAGIDRLCRAFAF